MWRWCVLFLENFVLETLCNCLNLQRIKRPLFVVFVILVLLLSFFYVVGGRCGIVDAVTTAHGAQEQMVSYGCLHLVDQ